MSPKLEGTSVPTGVAAAGVGALVACCTVKLLVLSGLLTGAAGWAIGGAGVGAGLLAAVTVWLLMLLAGRRSRRRRGAADVRSMAIATRHAGQGRWTT